MSKSQQNEVYKQANQNIDTGNNANQEFQQGIKPINSGYEAFAANGGIDPATQQSMLRTTSGQVSSMYNNALNELGQRNRVQGGYNPGFGANVANLSRQATESGSEATQREQNSIAQMVQQGKLAGLGGQGQVAGMGLQSTGLNQSNTNANLGVRNQISARPGWFQTAIGDISSLAGAGPKFTHAF